MISMIHDYHLLMFKMLIISFYQNFLIKYFLYFILIIYLKFNLTLFFIKMDHFHIYKANYLYLKISLISKIQSFLFLINQNIFQFNL